MLIRARQQGAEGGEGDASDAPSAPAPAPAAAPSPPSASLWSMAAVEKVIQLPGRVRAASAQALMTLHGQLYVRVDDGQ
jgi:hypothetical protein